MHVHAQSRARTRACDVTQSHDQHHDNPLFITGESVTTATVATDPKPATSLQLSTITLPAARSK